MSSAGRGTMLRDSLLVVLGYVLIRAGVYHLFLIHASADWSARDAWMTLPRAAAFFSVLALNRWRWERGIIHSSRIGFKEGAVAIGVVAVEWLDAAHGRGPAFPAPALALGIAVTVFVGLFEEYAFRGAILSGLREWMDDRAAVLVSALLFMAFHIQAQPFSEWPLLFLFGVVFANLRVRGMGLPWLAACHFLADIAYFFFGTEGPFRSGPLYAGECAVFAVLIALTWPRGRADRPA